MCGQDAEERCCCCDPAGRRAAYRTQRLRENGFDGEVDEEWAALSVAGRAVGAAEHPEAAYDPSASVRAARAAVTAEGVEHAVLAADSHETVRVALARNVRVAAIVLARLATDVSRRVRAAVAANRATPAAVLTRIAASLDLRRDFLVAQALATNPSTPDATLRDWADHGTAGQQRLAWARLSSAPASLSPAHQLMRDAVETRKPPPRSDADRVIVVQQDGDRAVLAYVYEPAWRPEGARKPVVWLTETTPGPGAQRKRVWVAEGQHAADLARSAGPPASLPDMAGRSIRER